ncbi:unnamed protein product [Cercospora beticola]|nr:unnamed protein product [Cercospora beticola]
MDGHLQDDLLPPPAKPSAAILRLRKTDPQLLNFLQKISRRRMSQEDTDLLNSIVALGDINDDEWVIDALREGFKDVFDSLHTTTTASTRKIFPPSRADSFSASRTNRSSAQANGPPAGPRAPPVQTQRSLWPVEMHRPVDQVFPLLGRNHFHAANHVFRPSQS